jgi:hypothetical protein
VTESDGFPCDALYKFARHSEQISPFLNLDGSFDASVVGIFANVKYVMRFLEDTISVTEMKIY